MDVVMPQLGETVKEGTVTAWHKKVGDPVEQGELLFEVSTDKVDTEIPAPASGVVSALLVPVGQTVSVGTALAVIDEPGKPRALTRPPTTEAEAMRPARSERFEKAQALEGGDVPRGRLSRREGDLLSPVVRKLIAEHHLNPAEIAGTGAAGRITRSDVLAYLDKRRATEGSGDPRKVLLSRIRKRTAEQMALSWKNIPHVLQAVEVDFQAVEQARSAHAAAWKAKEGWSLTYLPFVAHAVCAALGDFPVLNATFEGDALLLNPRINLAVAVDLGEEGLIAPVVKDAHRKSLPDLAKAIHALIEKARARGLAPDDMTEGTYTLSNSGSFGTLLTAPIINPPQVAILSIDGVARKPVAVQGPGGETVAIRPIGVLAQSFDHRALDGAHSAAFLRRLKSILETRDWSTMLADDAESGSAPRLA
jgi:2-oxoglutarate dehydrogenase E2 component (dihydrolipoamide succinyltransferase)